MKQATGYYIYKYKRGYSKKLATYKVKNKKLYKYNAKSKKWVYVNKVKVAKNGSMTCTLPGLKKNDINQKYCVKAVVSKKGYKTSHSLMSNRIYVY